MKKINFNELPKYHNWPKIFMEEDDFKIKKKNHKEIFREFEEEKWKKVNDILNRNPGITIQKLEKIIKKNDKTVCVINNQFYNCSPNHIESLHLKEYSNTISKYISEIDQIVELGAGYGSKILKMALDKRFMKKKFIAGELTEQGQFAIKELAKNMKLDVQVGFCDIAKGKFKDLKINKNSLIFTSYSACYASNISINIYKKILSLNPKVIIHFEPIYEFFSDNLMYDLMCRKYIKINDYKTNLISTLEKLHNKKSISLKIKKNIIGSNPFLPISIIECKTK